MRNPALFTRGATESAIAATLAAGIESTGSDTALLGHAHHSLLMPKFDHLTERERRSLAMYVIALGAEAVKK